MRKPMLAAMLLIFTTVLAHAQATAQEASPVAVVELATLVLIERAENVTNLDLGDPGPSAGDLIVWGPNALYDETNITNTGATTQGFCVVLDASGICELTETIVFPDGSTIELQGVQAGGSGPSTRTIVGGSGQYLGATGTVGIQPSEDLSTWIKTFEIHF